MSKIPHPRPARLSTAILVVADAFERAGDLRRAGYLRRCSAWRPGGADHPCRDRACPRCGPRWARDMLRSTLDLLGGLAMPGGLPRGLFTLSTFGATERGAWAKLRQTWRQFIAWARRRGFVFVGVRHLRRGSTGRWHAHVHALVYSAAEAQTGVLAEAWERAGGHKAWEVRLDVPRWQGLTLEEFMYHRADDDLTGFVGYMFDGAVDPLRLDPRDVVAWARAIRGEHLAIRPRRPRARDTEKRDSTPVTVRDLAGIADRVVEMVRAKPRTMSELQRGLTPRRRAHLVEVVDALTKDGRIAVVRGVGRAVRWATTEPRGRRRRHPKLAA